MILAKNRFGQVGRMIPGTGFGANVDPAASGARRGSVYISTRSIEEDENYYRQKEQEANGLREAKRLESIALRNADLIRHQKRAKDVEAFQRLATRDPMNEKLRQHYAKRAGMGESEVVADSLLRNPANFSSSGGNPEIVASEGGKRPIVWSADWRQHLIVGNPLTRDGEYGPAITDYDRYSTGTDVNQENVVNIHGGVDQPNQPDEDDLPIAGGTMLGRYDGRIAPAGMGSQAMSGHPRSYPAGERRGIPRGLPGKFRSDQGMGWELPSWDDITSGLSDVASRTQDQLIDDLPAQLANELKKAITGGGKVVSTGGGTITVQRPLVTSASTQIMGMPKWAVYAGIGLIGVGTLFMVVKAVKK